MQAVRGERLGEGADAAFVRQEENLRASMNLWETQQRLDSVFRFHAWALLET
jgi:hypothetical protein